jgi:hypothetical protein
VNIPNTTDGPPVEPTGAGGPVFLWRRPTALAMTALCSAVLLFYDRLWWPGLVLTKRDAFRFFLPLKQYMAERLLSGELPEWFPYESLGRPFLSVAHAGVFHFFSLLYLVFPSHEAYRFSVLLSCLMGAVGAYALGRALSCSRTGSMVAGLAFACSGYVASLTDNIVYLYSICLLPFFCLFLDFALRRHAGWVVASAMVWASVFLNGDVQTGYYYGWIALLWMAARARQLDRQVGIRLIGVIVLAGLLAGIQLAPAVVVYLDSERALPSFKEQAFLWSTHPLRIITMVAGPIIGPADNAAEQVDIAHHFFGGHPSGKPPVGYWAESLYMGMPLAGLALLGAWQRRDLRGLAWLGGIALLLSLGKYGGLYELCRQFIPLWSAFRFPEKFMGVVSFAVAMLAGAGFDELRKGRGYPVLWFVAAVVCLGIGGALGLEAVNHWVERVAGAPRTLTEKVTTMAAHAFFFSAIASGGVGLVALGIRRRWKVAQHLVLVLIAIFVLDLARANQEAYHTGFAGVATFTSGLAEAITRHSGASGPGQFRMLPLKRSRTTSPSAIRESLDSFGVAAVIARQALDVGHNASFHIESLGIYLPASSKTFLALRESLPASLKLNVYARYNVAYIVGHSESLSDPLFAQSHVATLPDHELALVTNPYPVKPRTYLSHRPERVSSPVDLHSLFARTDFLNGEVDVIEAFGRDLPGSSPDGKAEMIRYAPETVEVRVDTPAPAVLVLLDAFDAGWRATLEDGQEVPIFRANGIARAVPVPGGSHTVTFRYQTPFLKEGMALSLFGGMLCLAMLVRAKRSPVGGDGFEKEPRVERSGGGDAAS